MGLAMVFDARDVEDLQSVKTSLLKKTLKQIDSLRLPVRKELTRRSKIKNARASFKKAKANGTKWGRKKVRDDYEIIRLRNKGFTIRKIAELVKLSTGSVQRALKQAEGGVG